MICTHQDEKFDKQKGPSIEELVAKEKVDKLSYVGWMVDQGADPKKVSHTHIPAPPSFTLPSSRMLWRHSHLL